MFVEIVATSMQDCRNILSTTADRVLLASEIEKGGMTPSKELLENSIKLLRQPAHVVIRNTDRSYVYNDEEFKTVLEQIEFVKKLGYAGIVIGVLTTFRKLDTKKLKKIIDVASPMEVTFSRAFDLINDKASGLRSLDRLGVNSVLTSGGEINSNAIDHLKTISDLIYQSKKVRVIACGGLKSFMLSQLRDAGINAVSVGSGARIRSDWTQPISIGLISNFKR